MISVTSNADQVARALNQLARQTPYAISLAINRIAELSKPALQSNMSVVFDKPKPFVLNSIFVKRSTKRNLTATVFHSDRIAPYLVAEIHGGARGEKPFEVKIGGVRGVLVPTRNVARDPYGGVSKSVIKKILSKAKDMKDRNAEFVIVPPSQSARLSPGVYQRKQGKIRALFLFKSHADYRPRYDMKGVVERVVRSEWPRQFPAAMDYALATAKVTA